MRAGRLWYRSLREEYYRSYLGFDDHDCFDAAARRHGKTLEDAQIAELMARKSAMVQTLMSSGIAPQPGATELIRAAETAAVPLAICSGALQSEIELAARAVGVRDYFMAVISACDVTCGKPDPEGYRLALKELCRLTGLVLAAGKTLVVEDAPAGIAAAKRLDMKVLAVESSYDGAALKQADVIVGSLEQVRLADLERLFDNS